MSLHRWQSRTRRIGSRVFLLQTAGRNDIGAPMPSMSRERRPLAGAMHRARSRRCMDTCPAPNVASVCCVVLYLPCVPGCDRSARTARTIVPCAPGEHVFMVSWCGGLGWARPHFDLRRAWILSSVFGACSTGYWWGNMNHTARVFVKYRNWIPFVFC